MDGINKGFRGFTCCFCNKNIESSKFDPADVNVLINLDKPKNKQYNQSFYCHVVCFKEKMHDDLKSYFYLMSLLD